MSQLICPLCGAELDRNTQCYRCPIGHSFDIASSGYVHLLPANRKHAKDPGDDKGMAAARNRFLSGGWYEPLRTKMEEIALEYAPARVSLLDSGCGEGYYTHGVHKALSASGRQVQTIGVDLSKHALRWAAKRCPEGEFAVASVYRLPVRDQSVNLLINCFSPLAVEEFHRVIVPGGYFLYIVPGARHLWQMKEALYEHPYQNQEQIIVYDGFQLVHTDSVDERIVLTDSGSIRDLFQMTPYYWKTPREGAARLEKLDRLETDLSFRLYLFRRN